MLRVTATKMTSRHVQKIHSCIKSFSVGSGTDEGRIQSVNCKRKLCDGSLDATLTLARSPAGAIATAAAAAAV